MKNISILIFLFSVSILAEDNPYKLISARNAFDLVSKPPSPLPSLPPIDDIMAPTVFLTGVTKWKGTNKIHLVLRKAGESDKFVSLGINEKLYNVELKKILKDAAIISSHEEEKVISFEKNGLPTIITKKPPAKSSPTSSRYSRDKKEEKKSSPPPIKAQIITVPSRLPNRYNKP
jgi:hypothetical protein